MYAEIPEQAVKMRGLAAALRHRVDETADGYYRRMFQEAALELESAAEALERATWTSSP